MSAGRTVADYAADWEGNARNDAAYAVLSDPARRHEGWDAPTFLASGEDEVAVVWAELDHLGALPCGRRLAVDFGCGLGRLTVALAGRFEHALGIDVAPTMVARARQWHGGRSDRAVAFEVNDRPDLALLADRSVDLVYSNIVLQHVSTELQRAYLTEMVRVLAPGGVAVVQVPSWRRGVVGWGRRTLPPALVPMARRVVRPPAVLRRGPRPIRMEMNCLPEGEARALLTSAGGEVVAVRHTNATRPDFNGRLEVWSRRQAWAAAAGGGYLSPLYVVRRPS
jgi:SAM-dependent methyltransferase